MISFLAPLLLRIGIPERFAKAASWAVLIIAGIALLGLAKCTYDRKLIASHDAGQRAQVATGARDADQAADRAGRDREEASAAQDAIIQGVIENAQREHEADTGRPVGPATGAVLDELRRQRAAGSR